MNNNSQECLKSLILHKVQQSVVLQKGRKCRNIIAAGCVVLSASLLTCSVNAIEIAGNFHKGDESKAKGFSFVLADKFAKGSNFYWSVAYNSLDKVKVERNNDELFLKIDTILFLYF